VSTSWSTPGRSARLLDRAGHLRQERLLADPRHLHDERARLVDGTADHLVAADLLGGDRLADDERLVDRGRAIDHLAVDGDGLAGPDSDPITRLHLVDGNLDLLAVTQQPGGVGLQGHQLAHRLRRPRPNDLGDVVGQQVVGRDEHRDREEVGGREPRADEDAQQASDQPGERGELEEHVLVEDAAPQRRPGQLLHEPRRDEHRLQRQRQRHPRHERDARDL
jgi:hypothetical protein